MSITYRSGIAVMKQGDNPEMEIHLQLNYKRRNDQC